MRHTSASLVIQENADPSAKRDLERSLAWCPGIRSTSTTPRAGRHAFAHQGRAHRDFAVDSDHEETLALGTWQGIYLWEHRRRGSRREVVVHIGT